MTSEEHQQAAQRGRKIQESGLWATAAHYDARTGLVHVTLKAGMTICFSKQRSQALAHATDEQLSEVEVSAAGWSVDFPRLDDGFTIEGLLAGRFGNARWEAAWAEKQARVEAVAA